MGSQASVLDNSFMDSQSLLDCSSQLSQQPVAQSPVRNATNILSTDHMPHAVSSGATAPHMETSSLAKVINYVA